MFGIDDAIGAGLKILDKFIPDANARAQAAEDLQKAMLDASAKAESDQRDIDKTEAGSASMFVAGWRPAMGWLCVIALGYDWLIVPWVEWWAQVVAFKLPVLPHLESAETQTVLYAMLGIGTLRSVDKAKGIDTKSVGILGAVKSFLPFGKK